jgi:hypothetical protein
VIRHPAGTYEGPVCLLVSAGFRGISRGRLNDGASARSQNRRRSGFFYRPFMSRFYAIQFYGFRVRAIQDSWFAVHARIACMTDGQSARFAWNTACDPRTHLQLY